MRIIRHPSKKKLKPLVIALGNFDGVHRGHQKVIKAAIAQAKKTNSHCAVITFDPHPQEVVAKDRALRLITTLKERETLFRGLGIDAVIVFRFSHRLQNLSPEKFVKRYLVDKLGVKWIFVGYDYAFGKGREAGVGSLKKMGGKYGFGVTTIVPVKVGAEIIKSAKIRQALSEGRFENAVKMLGHPYRIAGRVVRGHGRGKKLGFPTANIKIDPRKLIPVQGVYAGKAGGKKCAVNIGSRPTFGGGEVLIEAHILGFSGSLKGKCLTIDIFARLRDEKQFSDAKLLREQIKKDIVRIEKM